MKFTETTISHLWADNPFFGGERLVPFCKLPVGLNLTSKEDGNIDGSATCATCKAEAVKLIKSRMKNRASLITAMQERHIKDAEMLLAYSE